MRFGNKLLGLVMCRFFVISITVVECGRMEREILFLDRNIIF